jgi:hypothetical protein
MRRPLLLATLLLAATPVLAAQNPPAANLYKQPDMRSIAVQNWSSHDVTEVQVQTTDGKVWDLAKGSIPSDQAAEILVPARDCIANVRVRFNNGRMLQLTELHACRNTQVVIRNEGLSIPQQAVPGAQQHATSG